MSAQIEQTNRNGGLTLVAMPGFESLAEQVKIGVEIMGTKPGRIPTPVDVVYPACKERASGEPFIQLSKDHVGGHDCVILTSGPGTYKMRGQLEDALRYSVGRRAQRIAVITGYFPLSRSDKDEGEKEFAMVRLVFELMMAASYNRLDRIIAADLHAPQVVMAGDTGKITEVSLVRRILKCVLEDAKAQGVERLCLALPDDGAAKRIESAYTEVEESLGIHLPIVFGAKRRATSRQSKIEQLFGDLLALEGALVIMLDDELATGGTNIHTAEALKEKHGAAQVWAAVTHGVFCPGAEMLFADPACAVDRVYSTDTIPFTSRPHLAPLIQSGKLRVISWLEDLVKLIYFHHWDIKLRPMR